jgi:hypothetical protein
MLFEQVIGHKKLKQIPLDQMSLELVLLEQLSLKECYQNKCIVIVRHKNNILYNSRLQVFR